MRNASWSRWLLLLAGLGAVSGCAQMSSAGYTHGQSAYAVGPSDPRYQPDPSLPAEARTLEKRWAGKRDGSAAARHGPLATAPSREPPGAATGAIRTSDLQQPASPPMTADSGTTTRRSLFDKQPWEIELDHVVRSICRGC
jgi:hypothetical protein